jgi:prolyl oligopeptidase
MHSVNKTVPISAFEPVMDILHGASIEDPYRWLEDQDAPRTRQWLEEQARYAQAYLGSIPGIENIRARVREFLAVETYDSLQKVGNRYFFRKRLPDQEQPCVCMRDGPDGQDQLLLDPAARGTGLHTALRPLCVSPDGRLLLYEIKQGGERMGRFELFDIEMRETLPDILPRGYLRGFAFTPDSKGFYYVHESLEKKRRFYRAAYLHVLGTSFGDDQQIFAAGVAKELRLCFIADTKRIGFLVYKFLDKTRTSFYLKEFDSVVPPRVVIADADYVFSPKLVPGRTLAITDKDAPNYRIVEICFHKNESPKWIDVVRETALRITSWTIVGDHIFVSRVRHPRAYVSVFDFSGRKTNELPLRDDDVTIRLVGGTPESDELLIEAESFTEPISIWRYSEASGKCVLWARRSTPFPSRNYRHTEVAYLSKDGTRIPMFLAGRNDVLGHGAQPVVMTGYGGSGISMTPQFSVFVAFLMERGCVFALPNIRGGSEFGAEWHNAAKRLNRQTAYDDFLSAAEWLINSGRTTPDKLAIFGGSNAGLLVGAALTQRPELFRAAVCMAPLLDMLRYHLFDNASVHKGEFGTADDPDDFVALAKYSPYHQVRKGAAYPAILLVSGDADQNCNPLHARKMTARLQAATGSDNPILLDYSPFRGHSPVLPLSERVEGLTNRLAFLCDHLRVSV